MTALPEHVAIIMDGNGRWAGQRGLPRSEGHTEGAEAVRRSVRYARRVGVKHLTLFAFSTLNWARPTEEVSALMDLLARFLVEERKEMLDNGIRLEAIGELEFLSAPIRALLEQTMADTACGKDMVLTLAVSYDGRRDLVRAAQRLTALAHKGELLPADVGEAQLAEALSTRAMPDVDLLIRTSGERRLSGFLPFEACYAELCFLDVLWPDFDEQVFQSALDDFSHRQRRFGLTGEQISALG
ncbi:MAG: polyprenyl diphosphate synthase [Bradymonadia bacterium]